MAKRVPKPTVLHIKSDLNTVIKHIEKAMGSPLPEENDNYEYGNGGEIQLKPEERINAAERHPAFDPVMRDPSEGKVNKADPKNIAGTGAGALIGSAMSGGNPLAAAAGGIVGNEITKPKDTSGMTQLSADSRLLRCNTELKLKKAIALAEGYSPMTYVDLVKAFGTTENIPDVMKEELYRPPASWFEVAIIKSSSLVEEPFGHAVSLWYGKDLDISKLNPALGAAIAEDPEGAGKGVGEAARGIGQGLNSATGGKGIQSVLGKAEDDNIEKLIGGGLLGAGVGSLLGHPIAGAAIGAGAEEAGGKLLGKSLDLNELSRTGGLDKLDPTKLGMIIIEGLKEKCASNNSQNMMAQKAVAEPLNSKASPKLNKEKFDFGGQSNGIHDGSGINIHDLADKSKTTKTN
jgi:hypothetical protein